MELLIIPKKFKRSGIKIKCLKCKWQISDTCRAKNSRISSCEHKDKHRFQFIVCVPKTKSDRITKITLAKTFEEALIEYVRFKNELINNSYQRVMIESETKPNNTLVALAAEYLDSLSGINTYSHLIRIRSKAHINESKKVLERFCFVLKDKGYKVDIMEIGAIRDREIGFFHEYLTKDLKLSKRSTNKHFVIMKSFINWVIKYKMIDIKNFFSKAQLTFDKTEKTIITKPEFEKLLSVVTYENGWGFHSGERRNFYKCWLPLAYRLALQTGARAEELVCLRWSNIIEIEPNVLVMKIDNLKANRIQSGSDKGVYTRPIPITKGLLKLLIEIGYDNKAGSNEYILERPENITINYMMSCISRSFGHYIKLATPRKIEFKDLRKTYITRLTMVLGENTKIFSGHSDSEVLKNHYIANAYVVSNLKDFDVFEKSNTIQ